MTKLASGVCLAEKTEHPDGANPLIRMTPSGGLRLPLAWSWRLTAPHSGHRVYSNATGLQNDPGFL